MGLVVNTNIAALNAQRNLDASGVALGRSMQRLSSGLRINSAADDAAGLAIATRLGAQVRGVNQAIRNANDGMAMLQTAEGALSEVTNIVTRIKELAVQSANGSNSASDRTSLNSEVSSLLSEVTRIATQTKFGNTALLDGSFSGTFQVGTEVGQTVSQSIASFKASSLSATTASQTLTFNAAVGATGAADANTFTGIATNAVMTVSGPKGTAFTRAITAADDTTSHIEGTKSAIAVAKVVNEITPTTGVSATVTAATFSVATAAELWDNVDIDGTTKFVKINGQSVVVNLNAGSQAGNRQLFVNAVNQQVSGVVASVDAGNSAWTLTAADGRNISIQTSAGTADGDEGEELFQFTGADLSTESVVARGGVKLMASGDITTTFTNGSTVIGEGLTSASSTTLSSIGVDTVANANMAMLVTDAILDTISNARGSLGAVQNRLGSTVANLGVVAEKVSDARSRILDADFAAETAAMTKAQILQQAGIAILSQANSNPQQVLGLLRG